MPLFKVFANAATGVCTFRAPAGFVLDRSQVLLDARLTRRRGLPVGECLSRAIAAQIDAYAAQRALSEALASVARTRARAFCRPSVACAG